MCKQQVLWNDNFTVGLKFSVGIDVHENTKMLRQKLALVILKILFGMHRILAEEEANL